MGAKSASSLCNLTLRMSQQFIIQFIFFYIWYLMIYSPDDWFVICIVAKRSSTKLRLAAKLWRIKTGALTWRGLALACLTVAMSYMVSLISIRGLLVQIFMGRWIFLSKFSWQCLPVHYDILGYFWANFLSLTLLECLIVSLSFTLFLCVIICIVFIHQFSWLSSRYWITCVLEMGLGC